MINPRPVVYAVPAASAAAASARTADGTLLPQEIYDYIRDIKVTHGVLGLQDPEHPYTLEQLKVVQPDLVWVEDGPDQCIIRIEYTPTVPHCSLATLIGLCLREKLGRVIDKPFKVGPGDQLDIYVTKGKHSTEAEINKQVNDKERVAAALENPSLMPVVEQCIRNAGDY